MKLPKKIQVEIYEARVPDELNGKLFVTMVVGRENFKTQATADKKWGESCEIKIKNHREALGGVLVLKLKKKKMGGSSTLGVVEIPLGTLSSYKSGASWLGLKAIERDASIELNCASFVLESEEVSDDEITDLKKPPKRMKSLNSLSLKSNAGSLQVGVGEKGSLSRSSSMSLKKRSASFTRCSNKVMPVISISNFNIESYLVETQETSVQKALEYCKQREPELVQKRLELEKEREEQLAEESRLEAAKTYSTDSNCSTEIIITQDVDDTDNSIDSHGNLKSTVTLDSMDVLQQQSHGIQEIPNDLIDNLSEEEIKQLQSQLAAANAFLGQEQVELKIQDRSMKEKQNVIEKGGHYYSEEPHPIQDKRVDSLSNVLQT